MAITAGTLIGASWRLLQRQWLWLMGTGLVEALMQMAQRQLVNSAMYDPVFISGLTRVLLFTAVVVLLQFSLQAFAIRQVLLREGFARPEIPARYGHFLLVMVLVNVASLLGTMLLIVPGVLILLRWLIAPGFTLTRGMNTLEALTASRDATRGHRGAMLGALLVLAAVWLVPYGLLMWSAGGLLAINAIAPLSGFGLARLGLTVLGAAASLAFAIGFFMELGHDKNPLSEVFA